MNISIRIPMKALKQKFFTVLPAWYRGTYRGYKVVLCIEETQRYLSVGEKWDLCISTQPPRHQQYYQIERKKGGKFWHLTDVDEADFVRKHGDARVDRLKDYDDSPWMSDFDFFLSGVFKQFGVIYLWAEK